MIIKKSTYKKMLREIEYLTDANKNLIRLREEERIMMENKLHKTSPLCKGCKHCIETGVGYFSEGLQFEKYECRLNQTCDDFVEDDKT